MTSLRVFVFLGAFLLFALEPMVGRLLLPGFGGGFQVWTTSLMFFQAGLFLAYSYAHLAAARMRHVHLVLLALPLVLLPPTARVVGEGDIGALLATLGLSFGVPFVALATTGVVAQGWLARSSLPSRSSPYFLYATSNAGSFSALLLYALVIEPLVGLYAQRIAWSLGFVAYLVVAVLAYRATHGAAPRIEVEATAEAEPPSRVAPSTIAYWLLLSAFPSVFLMAVTNLIALDAGNVPLVWVAPLALYLLTFVLAFAEPSRVPATVTRLWPHFGAVGLFFFAGGDVGGAWAQVVLQLFVLFVVCLAAHGELHARRPSPRHLTLYYLVGSLGGGLGGAFVALGAPVLFDGLHEYPIAIVGLAITIAIARRHELLAYVRGPGRGAVAITAALAIAMIWRLTSAADASSDTRTVSVRRSFYGIYTVLEGPSPSGTERRLLSGTTRHGRQLLAPELRVQPVSYYHPEGPLGAVMQVLDARTGPRRIGIVGLGIGGAAAYGREGDAITFFEIDPAVVDIAREDFTYLAESRATIDVSVRDARLALADLRDEPNPPRYDLLFVDAFAGDAIPTHLVTREAVELYRGLLAPNGVLLFHCSNRYYALPPVLAQIARTIGMHAAHRSHTRPQHPASDASEYLVMLEDEAALAEYEARGFVRVTATVPPPMSVWTDDHASTLTILMPD